MFSANFPCPKNFNPADHYIRTLAVIPGQEKECKKQIKVVVKIFQLFQHFLIINMLCVITYCSINTLGNLFCLS